MLCVHLAEEGKVLRKREGAGVQIWRQECTWDAGGKKKNRRDCMKTRKQVRGLDPPGHNISFLEERSGTPLQKTDGAGRFCIKEVAKLKTISKRSLVLTWKHAIGETLFSRINFESDH